MARGKQVKSGLALLTVPLVAFAILASGGSQAGAANDTEATVASLTLTKNLKVDRKLDAFSDPVLIRIKARTAPPWRGPLGKPPWTERRFCLKTDLLALNDFPPYC